MIRSQIRLFHGPGLPLERREVSLRELRPGEALVRMRLCTLCGSDLHSFTGRRGTPLPTILGHEMLGVVEAVAGSLKDLNDAELLPGDRIVWGVAIACGSCPLCLRDLPQKCQRLRKYGHEAFRESDGVALGGLAERLILPAGTAIVRVPEELPDAVAAPAGCATATVAGLIRHLLPECQSLLILGAGMLGLTAAAFAARRGVSRILLLDRDASRLARAHAFGATATLATAQASPAELHRWVLAQTDQLGADAVLELSGDSALTQTTLEALRIGGQMLLAGAVFPTPALRVLPELVIRRCLRIQGVHNYHPRDLQAAVRFLAESRRIYPFEELVSLTRDFAQAESALEDAERLRPLRMGVRFDP